MFVIALRRGRNRLRAADLGDGGGRRRERLRPEPGRPRGSVSGEAVNALAKVLRWAEEIDAGLATRADIARREGVSRARVTQLMKLLDLGHDVREAILSGEKVCSVREAIAEAVSA